MQKPPALRCHPQAVLSVWHDSLRPLRPLRRKKRAARVERRKVRQARAVAAGDEGEGYSAVSPKEHPPQSGPAFPILSRLTAPILGSPLLFPARFDRAAARLAKEPGAGGVEPQQALWYFGPALALQVDAARLNWRLSDYVRDARGIHYIGASFLDGANWSGALERLIRSPVHREMLELVRADLRFRETRSYRIFRRQAEAGRPPKRNGIALATTEQIDAYFGYCSYLILSIRERGIVARRDLSAADRPHLNGRQARPWTWERAERDIGVAVDQDGGLVRHLGGKHRTAIAQALRLPRIPVEVRLVHVKWLQRQMERTGLPAHRSLKAGLETLGEARD